LILHCDANRLLALDCAIKIYRKRLSKQGQRDYITSLGFVECTQIIGKSFLVRLEQTETIVRS